MSVSQEPQDPAAFSLREFAERIMVEVAMRADLQRVGVDGDEAEYQRWADELHNAIDNGLEDAERRAIGADDD